MKITVLYVLAIQKEINSNPIFALPSHQGVASDKSTNGLYFVVSEIFFFFWKCSTSKVDQKNTKKGFWVIDYYQKSYKFGFTFTDQKLWNWCFKTTLKLAGFNVKMSQQFFFLISERLKKMFSWEILKNTRLDFFKNIHVWMIFIYYLCAKFHNEWTHVNFFSLHYYYWWLVALSSTFIP